VWNFRSLELSLPRSFVPWNFRSIPGTFAPWNFRSLELLHPGTFDPWNFRSLELSFLRTGAKESKTKVQVNIWLWFFFFFFICTAWCLFSPESLIAHFAVHHLISGINFLSHSASLAQNTLLTSRSLIHLPPAHHYSHPPSHVHSLFCSRLENSPFPQIFSFWSL